MSCPLERQQPPDAVHAQSGRAYASGTARHTTRVLSLVKQLAVQNTEHGGELSVREKEEMIQKIVSEQSGHGMKHSSPAMQAPA